MRLLTCCALMLGCFLNPVTANAQKKTGLKNENLLVGVPSGYKIAFTTRKGNMKMTEMIPKNEDLKSWTEMVTVQIFLNNRKLKPVNFYHVIRRLFAKTCKGSRAQLIKHGMENGYVFSFFFINCHKNPKTGKRETVWFKALRGKDSFYVVQKAWRKKPRRAGIIKWSKYLRKVAVCDTRRANSKCPRIHAPKTK